MWGKVFILLVVIPGAAIGAAWVLLRSYGHSSLGSVKRKRLEAVENKRIREELKNLTTESWITVYGDEREWAVTSIDRRSGKLNVYEPTAHERREIKYKDISRITLE